jgi:CheY-like chemotaxis protein
VTATGTFQPRPLILVVDDADAVTLVVRHLGRRMGHDVEACADVPSAWAAVCRRRPNLLLLDVNLPGESGLVLCRRVRATADLADLPLAVFGHPERPLDLVAGLEAGADFVLSKDLMCRPADWMSRIRELLTPRDDWPYGWQADTVPPRPCSGTAERWAETLNRAVRRLVLPHWGTELAQALVQRALRRAGHDDPAAWLLPDGVELKADVEMAPAQWAALTGALAQELWCIGGVAISEPFWKALTATVPALAELDAHA